MKQVVHLIPKKVRRAVYRLPYGFRLKSKLGAFFFTQQSEWTEFRSGPRAGMKMKLKLPEENEFFLETHDPEITQLLVHMLRPSQVFVDVGAHIGYYALLASRLVGPQGKVFALEPSPATALRLQEHLIHNGCMNTRVLVLAASDRNGDHLFLEFATSTLNALASSKDQVPLAREREGIELLRSSPVECRTLDFLLEDGTLPPPDFIKIDVEGLELSVVQGMEKILDQIKPYLLIELHHPHAVMEVPRFLKRRGYLPYRMDTPRPGLIRAETKFEDRELRQGVNVLFSSRGALDSVS